MFAYMHVCIIGYVIKFDTKYLYCTINKQYIYNFVCLGFVLFCLFNDLFWSHSAVLRGYTLLCAQKLLLAGTGVRGEHMGRLDSNHYPSWISCIQGNFPTTVLSIRSLHIIITVILILKKKLITWNCAKDLKA